MSEEKEVTIKRSKLIIISIIILLLFIGLFGYISYNSFKTKYISINEATKQCSLLVNQTIAYYAPYVEFYNKVVEMQKEQK
jgi:flagellar basal body-associated protein FliL